MLRSGFQEKYYQQAQKIRRQLKMEFAEYLGKVDALLLPTYPVPPFPIGKTGLDSITQKQCDIYTSIANLTGLPAITIPSDIVGGLPVGVQLMSNQFCEEMLFYISESLERLYPVQRPEIFVER